MSLVDQQKELEYYPDEVLAQEMMQPTGIAPSFLVATEIKRRNDMRNAYQSQMNPQPQTSVVEEEAMELGGIANADPNAMQQQMMQQPMPQGAPMQMAEGGTISYDVEDGASVTVPDDEAGFLSAGLGAAGLLREGGAIRYQEGGSPLVGRGGTLFDYTNPWDYALAGMMFAPIPGSRLAASTIKAGKLGKAAGISGLGKGLKPFYKTQPRNPMGRFSTDAEVGKQALQYPIRYINPKATEFKTRTLPVAGGAGLLAGVGGEDSGIGTESDASIIEDVNAETISIDDMTTEDLQALIKQRQDDAAAEAAKRERELKEGLETKRREALPDSARMLEDAMANVPENTTFQDYLSTLEGMEESRKGQVLMDLGASIANASHGGDIAKGFQEAGTKARAEKIEVAKERARVLGESRAMDINTSLKMAEIDAALMKSDQITLSGWLDLFADNPDLIESVEDADDPIAQMIKILSRLGVNTDNMEAIVEQTGTK